jgi:hypothetical protein
MDMAVTRGFDDIALGNGVTFANGAQGRGLALDFRLPNDQRDLTHAVFGVGRNGPQTGSAQERHTAQEQRCL